MVKILPLTLVFLLVGCANNSSKDGIQKTKDGCAFIMTGVGPDRRLYFQPDRSDLECPLIKKGGPWIKSGCEYSIEKGVLPNTYHAYPIITFDGKNVKGNDCIPLIIEYCAGGSYENRCFTRRGRYSIGRLLK